VEGPAFESVDLQLRDGRRVHVRAVRPSDEGEFLQAFGRMAPESRYMRFMSAIREPNVKRLHEVLASLPERGLIIAATTPAPDGIDIVGSASFVFTEPDACEFAVAIADDWAGAGLGRKLMEHLIGAARRHGLAEMCGYVLAENRAMLGLAKRLGFSIKAMPGDFSLRVCTLALDDKAAPRTSP
jgi:acetyltransferase